MATRRGKSSKKRQEALEDLERELLANEPSASPLETVQSWWKWGQSLKREAITLHGWILTIVGLIQPYAVTYFDPADQLPGQPWAFYVAVLKLTAPLTIALAILAIALVHLWPEEGSGGLLMGLCMFGSLLLTAAMHIGNALGAKPVAPLELTALPSPVGPFVNALASYLIAYRGALFASSVAIALYAAYIWRRAMAEPASPPTTQQTPRRRAA